MTMNSGSLESEACGRGGRRVTGMAGFARCAAKRNVDECGAEYAADHCGRHGLERHWLPVNRPETRVADARAVGRASESKRM